MAEIENELNLDSDFYVHFSVDEMNHTIEAVRVRIDLLKYDAKNAPTFNIALCDHPLYAELKEYVKNNP